MIDYGCSGKRYQGCASRASAPGLDWAVENNSLHHVPMPVLQPILYPAFSRNYLDKHRSAAWKKYFVHVKKKPTLMTLV